MGVERRSFLASLALLGVDLTALAPTSSAQAVSAGERAVTVDGALIRDLDLTTAAYERIDHLPRGSRRLPRQSRTAPSQAPPIAQATNRSSPPGAPCQPAGSQRGGVPADSRCHCLGFALGHPHAAAAQERRTRHPASAANATNMRPGRHGRGSGDRPGPELGGERMPQPPTSLSAGVPPTERIARTPHRRMRRRGLVIGRRRAGPERHAACLDPQRPSPPRRGP